jgi:hypothetical protein
LHAERKTVQKMWSILANQNGKKGDPKDCTGKK